MCSRPHSGLHQHTLRNQECFRCEDVGGYGCSVGGNFHGFIEGFDYHKVGRGSELNLERFVNALRYWIDSFPPDGGWGLLINGLGLTLPKRGAIQGIPRKLLPGSLDDPLKRAVDVRRIGPDAVVGRSKPEVHVTFRVGVQFDEMMGAENNTDFREASVGVALNGDGADAAHGVFVHTRYCCTKDFPRRTELKVVAMQNHSSR